MSGHTKGPWKANRLGWEVAALDGTKVASMYVEQGTPTEANARLVAAAPELLEALKGMVAHYTGGRINHPVHHAADAAIAKAEGR